MVRRRARTLGTSNAPKNTLTKNLRIIQGSGWWRGAAPTTMASSISFSSTAGSFDGKCSPEFALRDAEALELVVQCLARDAERSERRLNPAFARRQRGANLAFLVIGDAHRQRARGRGLR